jgi:hypothetical protein
MEISTCNTGFKLTPTTLAITADSDQAMRVSAANQIYFDNLPNFINKDKNGLIVSVTYSDGTYEQYRHTTLAAMQPVDGSYKPGDGVAGSACKK